MSTQAITPDFIPAEQQPDFIPAGEHHQVDYSAGFHGFPQQPQSSAPVRLVKGALGTYLNATLNAGPTSGVPKGYGSADWQNAQSALDSQKTNSDYLSGILNSIKPAFGGPTAEGSLSAIKDTAKDFNPIDVQKFKSGDTAGGIGSSLMNLLLLRAGFKQMRGQQVPEFNAPNTSEIVGSLAGGKPVQPQKLLPPAPIELGPSTIIPATREGLLPAASRLTKDTQGNPTRQYLTRPLAEGEVPPQPSQPYDLLTALKIMRDRASLETPQGTGEPEAQGVDARMAEYAKTPWDVGGTVKPKYAYRVRDAGETGIIPRGHAQASLDPGEVHSYAEGRGQAQNAPQEVVRVDLSKLDPSEYDLVPGPNGTPWVRFKGAVPESYISKAPKSKMQMLQQNLSQPQTKQMLTGQDLIDALRQMQKTKSAAAGND